MNMVSSETGVLGKNPVFAQTMIRVKDPVKSRQFYEEQLGMTYLHKFDFPDMKFSLYFYAYVDKEKEEIPNLSSMTLLEQMQWLFSRPYPTMELTHNWGTESDPNFKYHNTNTEPRGFGHVGVIINDVHSACQKLEAAGVTVVRKPGPFKDVANIAFVADPDGYWIELIQRPFPSLSNGKEKGMLGPDPVYAQTMLRVKDPKKSLEFYQKLGMKFVAKLDINELDFSLYFLAYTNDTPMLPIDDGTERDRAGIAGWLWTRRYWTLELTHNYGTETKEDFSYHNGNVEPRGFGHIGILVDDIYGSCKKLEEMGYKIVRQPGPFAQIAEIAFVADPDGYWVELIKRHQYTETRAYSKPQ